MIRPSLPPSLDCDLPPPSHFPQALDVPMYIIHPLGEVVETHNPDSLLVEHVHADGDRFEGMREYVPQYPTPAALQKEDRARTQ